MEHNEWASEVRKLLRQMVGEEAATEVETEVEGFGDWWLDGDAPQTAAWAALTATGRALMLGFADPGDLVALTDALNASVDEDTGTAPLRPGVSEEFILVNAWDPQV